MADAPRIASFSRRRRDTCRSRLRPAPPGPVPRRRFSLRLCALIRSALSIPTDVMKRFLLDRWFLLALATVILIGLSLSRHLSPLADARILRGGIVVSVLFLMALPLELGAMWRVVRYPRAAGLAIAINSGLAPLVAWGIAPLLSGDLALGLMVAAATPCTLASASVWTRRAGGNDAIAIVVTVVTNLTCFIVTPLWLALLTQRSSAAAPRLGEMVLKLALLVVLPIVAAQLVRLRRPIGIYATRRKTALSVAAQCGVLAMVLLGTIGAGEKLRSMESGDAPDAWQYGLMIAAVLGVHLILLFTGLFLARVAKLARGDRIAVGFAGSQKTLMVGLAIAVDYGGLVLLPMVAYHVGQLLVDTIVADRMRKNVAERAQ